MNNSLAKFIKKYGKPKALNGSGNIPDLLSRANSEFNKCTRELVGNTFADGLYRVYRYDEMPYKTEVICRMFELAKNNLIVFSGDWNGKQFGISFLQMLNGQPSVECFDMGRVESFCTDMDIFEFHNVALIENAEDVFSEKMFNKWIKKHPDPISYEMCVGLKTPLFLGGEDNLQNMELQDTDVYLETCAQLWEKVKHMPDGTIIDDIEIRD